MIRSLDRYIFAAFIRQFLYIFGALTAVALLIEMIELLGRAASRDAPMIVVVELALLRAPPLAERIAVFAVLFGAIAAFFRLTRSQELIVARAAGVSAWRFIAPVLAGAALIGIIAATLFNPLAAATLEAYERKTAAVFEGRRDVVTVSDRGLWLRQANRDGHAVIHAQGVEPGGLRLRTVTVYEFDAAERFVSRIDAARATLEEGRWRLFDALILQPGAPPQAVAETAIATDLTLGRIQESFASPETMSFWDLPRFISELQAAGFSPHRHELQFNRLLSAPFFMAAMVLIAASFSLRLSRRGGAGKMMLFAVLSGFFFYLFSDVVFALGLSAAIPAILAAWTPPGVSLMIGSAALLHLEDG